MALQQHASPHKGTAELNLGHLRHQSDNQILAPAGFGAELKTEHAVALRSGMGMLVTTDGRSRANGAQMDSREAHAQITQGHALAESLAKTAQKHNAALTDGQGKAEAEPDKLPAIAAMKHSIEVLETTEAGDGATTGVGGGEGEVTAYSEPHLQLSSPAGIVATTPASAIFSAGNSGSISAEQDINFASQGNFFHAVKAGISLFTYGKASNPDKPNQETGIRLHAASGKFSSQSQSDETRITADKTITVASVTKSISITAKQHVLLTAQGAYLKLEGGNIMLHGPGKIEFKASMKELAGPQSSMVDLPHLPALSAMASTKAEGAFTGRYSLNKNRDNVFKRYRYRVVSKGEVIVEGKSSASGETEWINSDIRKHVKVYKTIMRDDQKITEDWQGALQKAVGGATANATTPPTPLDDEYIERYYGGDE